MSVVVCYWCHHPADPPKSLGEVWWCPRCQKSAEKDGRFDGTWERPAGEEKVAGYVQSPCRSGA